MTFMVPSRGTVPFIFNAASVHLEKVADGVTSVNTAVATAIESLQTTSAWANETVNSLASLTASITPLVSELIPIKQDPLSIVPNPSARFEAYNTYFHIIESRDMDVLQLLKGDVNLLYSMLIEMQIIRMDEQEIIHFLQGVAVRYEMYQHILDPGFAGKESEVSVITPAVSEPLLFDCRISTAFYRWFACHWDFAINLIHARHHFDKAGEYFDMGDFQSSSKAIMNAGTLLRATTADMVFGCSMPAKVYQQFIRPSMGEGFTGNDNPQWAIFATSKKDLLAKQGIKNNQDINRAWSYFLEKYLQDIEVHTTIADKLVGEKPSLTIDELNQGIPKEEQDKTPATSGLRNLHYKRLHEFAFLNSYPILDKLFKIKEYENS